MDKFSRIIVQEIRVKGSDLRLSWNELNGAQGLVK